MKSLDARAVDSRPLASRRPRVNRCRYHVESTEAVCPSIHPQQSATSKASTCETEATPLPFFAISSQIPGEVS